MITLDAALKAQQALRNAAGLGEEQFELSEFVGMVSDEIEQLRKQGHSDEEIASLIRKNSPVQVTGQEIAENYASPEQRHGGPEGR